MINTYFPFKHMLLLFARSSQSHATSYSSLMSHHRVNNKYNRLKGQHWRSLIYALHNFLLRNNMLPVFRSNHHRSWKFHEFHRKAPVLEYHFFLKMMKLYEDTIDLLSFYKEHLYGPECPPSPLSTRGGGGAEKI